MKRKVFYRFGAISQAGRLKVFCPPLWTCGTGTMGYFDEYGKLYDTVQPEHLRTCFFAPNTRLVDPTAPHVVEVPDDLYRTGFLDLNPFDIQELLAFQRRFGMIMGARELKHNLGSIELECLRPAPDGTVFAGFWAEAHVSQLEGIKASAAIFDTVPDEEYIDESMVDRLGAVSFLESIQTVLDTQEMIRDTLRVLRDDLPPITKREAGNARLAAEWLAALLPKSSPIVELVCEGTEDLELPIGLMDAIHLQLARGLLSNSAFRTCENPECRKLFSPVEVARRSDTKYCCPECQERAKRLRYIARHPK